MKQLVILERSKALAHAIIGIKVGWRHEKIGKRGITHFLEHAIFLGNESYPTPDNQVAKYGVQLEGMTLPEYTIFFFTSAKEDFTEILSIFLSLIFNPKFNKVKLEKEKKDKIITAVIQESDFTPWELTHEWTKNLIFNWQFMTSLGTEKDIQSITKEDLVIRHRKYYHSENSFIITYGDIQENEIAQLIKTIDIPLIGEEPSPLLVQYDKRKELFIERKGMKNVEMVYGFKILHYDPEWEILKVILGNYPISRLWGKKFSKFTYTVGSQLEWTNTGGGFFLYFGAISFESAQEIDKNLWQLLKNFDINEEELEVVKKIKILEILKMKEEGEQGFLNFFFSNPTLMYNDFGGMIDSINQVQRDKLITLARNLLTKENAAKVSVGTYK